MSYKSTQRWRHKARQWVNNLCGGKCQVCGYDRCQGNLAFHHVEAASKDADISRMINATVGWTKILKEVEKCVLVCHNCHGEIHAGLIECPIIDNEERSEKMRLIESLKPIPKSHKFNYCMCGSKISYRNKTCINCKSKKQEKIIWPQDQELIEMVNSSSKLAVSKKLGVSDKAVAKRINRLINAGVAKWPTAPA